MFFQVTYKSGKSVRMVAFVTDGRGFSSKGHFCRVKIKSIKISLKKKEREKKGNWEKNEGHFICSIQENGKKKSSLLAIIIQHSARNTKEISLSLFPLFYLHFPKLGFITDTK